MKTKNYILTLLLMALVIPSIASATWWNPLSWSKNSKQTDVVEPTPIKPVEKSIPVSEAKTSELKVVEKIIEKPITQTITVQDPALQSQINSLITENASLKMEIEKLLKANKSLNNELLTCEDTQVSSTQNDCEKANEVVATITEKLTEITKICREKREKEGVKAFCKEAQGIRPLQDKLSIARADIQLYCD